MNSDSNTKTEEYLRYGQIIRIHGNKEQPMWGIIAVKGFTDIDAKYITFQTFRNIEYYRQGLFQILPRGVFQSTDELIKLNQEKSKKTIKSSPDQEKDKEGNDKEKQKEKQSREKEEEEYRKPYLARAQAQRIQYQNISEAKQGEQILFGDDVIFKHVDSQAYLSGSVRCSEGGLGSFKVELSSQLSSMLVFKLLPFRSYEKQGERIKLEGPLRIKNIENRCYLSTEDVDEQSVVELSNQHEIKNQSYKEKKHKKFNIVTTYSQSQTWLIHLHEKHDSNKDSSKSQIHTHDIIYLRHTQKDGYLAIQKNNNFKERNEGLMSRELHLKESHFKEKNIQSEPILKELDENQYPCFSCLWEIEFLPIPKIFPNTNQQLGTQDTYSLRDLLTGNILTLAATTELKIINVKGSQTKNRIEDRDLIKIISDMKVLDLRQEEQQREKSEEKFLFRKSLPYNIRKLKLTDNDTQHGFRIIKIDDQTKREVLFVLSTYEVLKEFGDLLLLKTPTIQKNVKSKKLELVDFRLCQLIAYIKNCQINEIENEILPLKKYQIILKDLDICKIIFNSILNKMGDKIKEEIYSKAKKENELFKIIFNRCYYLVLQIIRNNPITKLDVSQRYLKIIIDHAIKIQQNNIHITLNEILNNNEAVVSKFLTSQLMARILQVFKLKPPHEKFLNIFRNSCISNGVPIINNQKMIIETFFQKIDPHINFQFIPDLITQQLENVDNKVQKRVDKYRIKIKCSIGKQNATRTISDFYAKSLAADLSQTWNYFLAFLNLLADVCYGRNTQGKLLVEYVLTAYFRKYFEEPSQKNKKKQQLLNNRDFNYKKFLDDIGIQGIEKDEKIVYDKDTLCFYILRNILEDPDIENLKSNGRDLLRAILRLINYAFVDTANQNPIRLSRLRDFKSISQFRKEKDLANVQDLVKKRYNQQLQKLKTFLCSKIKFFESFQLTDIKEKEFLLTVLDLLKSTLVSGCWTKYQSLLEMLSYLLKVLRNQRKQILGEQDEVKNKKIQKQTEIDEQLQKFKVFKTQAKQYTPSVDIIVKCKLLACQLIENILDVRTDERIRQCTFIFKQLIESPKKLNEEFVNKRNTFKYIEEKINHQFKTEDNDDGIDSESIISFEEEDQKKSEKQNSYLFQNPEIWIFEIEKLMNLRETNGELSKIDPSDNINLNLIMTELSIYQNSELIAKSLRILERIHNRFNQIINAFTNIGMYAGGETQQLLETIQAKRHKLKYLQDENILQMDRDSDTNKLFGQLTWFAHSIKKSFKLENYFRNHHQYENYRQIKFFSIFNVFSERDQINTLHQKLIKCLDLHPALLKFIVLCKDQLKETLLATQLLRSIYTFLTLLCKNHLQLKFQITPYVKNIINHIEWNVGALQLLFQLYSNNKSNLYNEEQVEKIASYISQKIQSRSITDYYKSKLMDFYRCLVYYNEDVIKPNQGVILAKLQDSKKINIHYRDIPSNPNSLNRDNMKQLIKEFEIKIGKYFFDYDGVNNGLKYKYLLVLIESLNKESFSVRTPFRKVRSQSSHSGIYSIPISISPQLTYYITLFNIFATLIEGRNVVNMGKCKQVHSYNLLMEILEDVLLCYPLKRNVRAYINRLYYVQKDYQNINETIVKKQLLNFVRELDIYIGVLIHYTTTNQKSKEGILQKFVIECPIRFQYFQTYFYLYFEELLISIDEIFHNDQFKSYLNQELNKNYSNGRYYLHYYIIRLFERLRYLEKRYLKYRFVQNFIRYLTKILKKQYLQKFPDKIFDKNQEGRDHDPNSKISKDMPQKQDFGSVETKDKKMALLKERALKLIKRLEVGQIESYYRQNREQLNKNFPLTFLLPQQELQQHHERSQEEKEKEFLKQKLVDLIYHQQSLKKNDQNQYYNKKIFRLRKIFNRNIFQLFLRNQFKEGCADLFLMNETSKKLYQFSHPFLQFKEYIITIVEINTQQPQAFSTNLKILFFRILREYIQSKNVEKADTLSTIDKWEDEQWSERKDQIEQAQNFLNSAKIPQLIAQSLKQEQDLELFNQIFLFGISFILGGNSECQNSILEKLMQDKKNEVFLTIYSLITRLGKMIYNLYEIRKSEEKTDSRFIARMIDVYDYFDTNDRTVRKKRTFQFPGPQQENLKTLYKDVFKRVYRFLQLLCQNNNQRSKNFMRKQIDTSGIKKINSINMIEVTTLEVRQLFKIMTKEISDLPLNLLDFLNEINQIPCQQNQKTLCTTTFFEDICYMASLLKDQDTLKRRHFFEVEKGDIIINHKPLFSIYAKCINIIICVLEGNDKQIYRQLSAKLEAKFLIDIFNNNILLELKLISKNQLQRVIEESTQNLLSDNFTNSINVLIILQKLREFYPESKLIRTYDEYLQEDNVMDSDNKNKGDIRELHKFLKQKYMLTIEIKSNKKKQNVYFPKHPILTQLSQQTRDKIMLDVGRSTQRQKLVDMISKKKEVFDQIEHNFEIEKKSAKYMGLIKLGISQTQTILSVSLIVSMIINFLWICGTDVFVEYKEVTYGGQIYKIIYWLSLIQCSLSIIYAIGYKRCKGTLAVKKYQFQIQQQMDKDNKYEQEHVEKIQSQSISQIFYGFFGNILQKFLNLFQFFVQFLVKYSPTFLQNQLFEIKVLFKYQRATPVLIYVLISILGIFYPQIFLLHQIYVFTRIQTLENVFTAITHNPGQLFYVSLLGIVFVFVFCILGYQTYIIGKMEEQDCQSLYNCLINMYISGTIGGQMQSFQGYKFLFDLVYFIFFEMLFGNIISGIMIDTFAELRSEREAISYDKQNKCYICGIDRADLEKENQKFSNHINKTHFLWNYLFYIYCLEHKSDLEKTGLEYEIENKIKKDGDISWIPIYNQEESEDIVKKKIDEIKLTLSDIKTISKRKSEEMNKLLSKEE